MSLGAGSRIDGPSQVHNRKSHIHFEAIRGDSKFHAATFPDNAHDTVEAATQSLTRRNDFTSRTNPPPTDVSPPSQQHPLPSTEPLLMSEVGPNSVKLESPWRTYQKGFELQFDKMVTVAIRRAPRSGKVAIKEYSDRDAGRKLEMLNRVSHEKFIKVLDVFEHQRRCYAVFEHVLVSLREVVGCPAYPTEQQLVAILAQILQGLDYLFSIGLRHGSLTCANVLLKPTGDIVLANQEHCLATTASDTADVRAVGHVAMMLMQKYAKDDGAIGIENLNRWPVGSTPVKFLAMTTSARSVGELEQHALFKQSWRKEDLEILAELASFTPRRSYKYIE